MELSQKVMFRLTLLPYHLEIPSLKGLQTVGLGILLNILKDILIKKKPSFFSIGTF